MATMESQQKTLKIKRILKRRKYGNSWNNGKSGVSKKKRTFKEKLETQKKIHKMEL
jgi:hypothetical protein